MTRPAAPTFRMIAAIASHFVWSVVTACGFGVALPFLIASSRDAGFVSLPVDDPLRLLTPLVGLGLVFCLSVAASWPTRLAISAVAVLGFVAWLCLGVAASPAAMIAPAAILALVLFGLVAVQALLAARVFGYCRLAPHSARN